MLLHLGKDSVIPLKDIIAIIDKQSSFKSEDTRQFFEQAENQGIVSNTSDKIKTYILTEKTIYTSTISSMTLRQRAGFMEDMINI